MPMDDWSDAEFRMFENMNLPDAAFDDQFVQLAYDMALFSPELDYETHVEMKRFLINFLADEYDFDFNSEFDWDDYQLSGESDA